MRLSARIHKLAEQVSQGSSVADIGTDHGYVPMILMRDNISPYVIMSDISAGSLAKAKETFTICGIKTPDTQFRIGDGLDTIASGEVDEVIIAGLGGLTIVSILDKDIRKSRSYNKLILQPRKHSGNLRYYLWTRGWDIVNEALAPEGKFVCEIIAAVPSPSILHDDDNSYDTDILREPPYPEDDIRWKYPSDIVKADKQLATKRISWKIDSITEQIENLIKSRTDMSDLICKLESDRRYLTELIH